MLLNLRLMYRALDRLAPLDLNVELSARGYPPTDIIITDNGEAE